MLPGTSLLVRKPLGMWGHRYPRTEKKRGFRSDPERLSTLEPGQPTPAQQRLRSTDAGALGEGFDLAAIREAGPFPAWLLGEMRSNQAGETGAVAIYRGCRAALSLRARYRTAGVVPAYEARCVGVKGGGCFLVFVWPPTRRWCR